MAVARRRSFVVLSALALATSGLVAIPTQAGATDPIGTNATVSWGSAEPLSITLTGSVVPAGIPTFTINGDSVVGSSFQAAANGTWTSTASYATVLSPGSYPVTVNYPGDSNYAPLTDADAGTDTVTKARTTASISADKTTPAPHEAVTFIGHVTNAFDGAPYPTGSINFQLDGEAWKEAAIDPATGDATLTTPMPGGKHYVGAMYTNDDNYVLGTLTDDAPVTVAGWPTSLQLSPIPSSFPPGSAASVTATVIPGGPDGSPEPTGSVGFTLWGGYWGSQFLTSSVDDQGKATLDLSTLLPGNYQLVANYYGDENYDPSIVNPGPQFTIPGFPAAVSVSTDSATTELGAAVTYHVTMTDGSGRGRAPLGEVTLFLDDGQVVGKGELSGVDLTHSSVSILGAPPALGSHSVYATYSGDRFFAAETSSTVPLTVTRATTVIRLINQDAGMTSYPQGAPVELSAYLQMTDGSSGMTAPTGSLSFTINGVTSDKSAIIEDPGWSTVDLSPLPVGTYTVQAHYDGDSNWTAGVSNPFVFQVVRRQAAFSINPSGVRVKVGQPVTLTANLGEPGVDGPALSGSASITCDGVLLGTFAVNGAGTYSVTTSQLDVGDHVLTAHYTGNADYEAADATGGFSVTGAPRDPKPIFVAGDRQLTVTYHLPENQSSHPPITYLVSLDGGVHFQAAGNTGQVVVRGLADGRTYRVVFRAANELDETDSAPISVTLSQWFADPLTAAQRHGLLVSPVNPSGYHGGLRYTTNYLRAHNGPAAMVSTNLHGRQLQLGQAAVLDAALDFPSGSATLDARGQADVRALATSLRYDHTVDCEGYADYAGMAGQQLTLSASRAQAVCAELIRDGAAVNTSPIGYGGAAPAIVGGTPAQRGANQRVVMLVTG